MSLYLCISSVFSREHAKCSELGTTFYSKPRQKTCQQQISVRKPKFQAKFAVALWRSGWLWNTWRACLNCLQPLQHSAATDVHRNVRAASPEQYQKKKRVPKLLLQLRRLTTDKLLFISFIESVVPGAAVLFCSSRPLDRQKRKRF